MTRFEVPAGDLSLVVDVVRMGRDLSVCVQGGSAPHVGCAVLAVPRPSLTGQGRSATTSVLNCLGHKDDELAAAIAKQLAARLDVTVTCVAGVHVNNASQATIRAILEAVSAIVERIALLY